MSVLISKGEKSRNKGKAMRYDLLLYVRLDNKLFQSLVGLQVTKAVRYESTKCVFFSFPKANLAIFGDVRIEPKKNLLSDFLDDRIIEFDASNPAAVRLQFQSGRLIFFNSLEPTEGSTERVIYSNRNIKPNRTLIVV
ncbi:MAG: hypothetical protein BWY75_01652 [bacterium ADurb.Bin425]|nr:MAG: hypothetical protein BWY75_01652 [bacterium ADurb.Bin425]